MYLVKCNGLWMCKFDILPDGEYEAVFTTNKNSAKDFSSNCVKAVMNDFDDVRIFRWEIRELGNMEIMCI